MLKDWKTELAKEIEDAKELQKEAEAALAKHKATLTPDKLAEYKQMLKQGREDFRIVLFGNGVHNKKYSMMLLDAAVARPWRWLCQWATAGSWIRGVLEQYVAGPNNRGRPEGRSYPRSQQATHEISGLVPR
jgi:hypothetical protein